MSIWIIGPSASGKSTLAAQLSERLDIPVVEAGSFARQEWPGISRELMTEKVMERLSHDHRYFTSRIWSATNDKEVIVAGIRNPVDFVECFDPKDRVLLLDAEIPYATVFEDTGIAAIRAILMFYLKVGIVQQWQVVQTTAQKDDEDWYAAIHCQF